MYQESSIMQLSEPYYDLIPQKPHENPLSQFLEDDTNL